MPAPVSSLLLAVSTSGASSRLRAGQPPPRAACRVHAVHRWNERESVPCARALPHALRGGPPGFMGAGKR